MKKTKVKKSASKKSQKFTEKHKHFEHLIVIFTALVVTFFLFAARS